MTAGTGGFRPRGRTPEPFHQRDRAATIDPRRVYRAADGFEVHLATQVLERAIAIGRSKEPMEWMGLLIGRLCEDARGRYVLVLGMVLDREARGERHVVHSTVESEATTRGLARDLFPDCVVLGWIHGHIRHGVTFSTVDRANQATWRERHAVGVVVDPWSPELLTVYCGPEAERLVQCSESGLDVPAASRTRDESRAPRLALGRPRWRRLVVASLSLVAAVAGFACGQVWALRSRVEHLERVPKQRTVPRERADTLVVVLATGVNPSPDEGRVTRTYETPFEATSRAPPLCAPR